MKRLYSTGKGWAFWILALGFGGLCIIGGAIQLVIIGYTFLAVLLALGFIILKYIGWNNRTELWVDGSEIIIIKVVDCKSREIHKCSYEKFSEMKFDEFENAAYFQSGNEMIGIGIGISEGKKMLHIVNREFKKLG